MQQRFVQKRKNRVSVCRLAILLAVIVLLVAACTTPQTEEPPATGSGRSAIATPILEGERSAQESPMATVEAPSSRGAEPMPTSDARERLIERAIEEVREEVNAAASDVRVASVEQVEWRDASLGCPKPGQMYAQVITPGYKIVLEANGNTYEFHTGLNGEGPLVRCDGGDGEASSSK